MAKTKTVSAPKGFDVIGGRGSDGKPWPQKVGDVLTGVVQGVKVLDARKAGRKDAKKGTTVRIVSIADANGELHAVWESTATREWCAKVRKGSRVWLRFNDVNKKTKFKNITAAIGK